MLAYHNDPGIKRKYLTRVLGHQKMDELIKGQYWENGKGCAVGCTVHSNSHLSYETELGIPVAIAYLEDGIFENLPNEKAKQWPVRLLSAITVGADLSLVSSKFMHWLLVDSKDGVIRFSDGTTRSCIEAVGSLYERRLKGDEPTEQEWAESAARAESAAWAERAESAASAAWAAWAAWAESAARAARAAWAAWAESAESAARAAWAEGAARAARAARAAWAANYIKMADKLIELLENEKPKVNTLNVFQHGKDLTVVRTS